ncbi:MAG: hypothetical protein KGO02_01270 [Alphaproteobacteria bacterium]|nr:hypothetical protein [Alphaproteobacteria bacterium]
MNVAALSFAPHLPWALIWLLAALAAAITGLGLVRRARGMIWRGLAFVLVLAALANPIIVHQTRQPLNDVVALAVDQTQSMDIGGRKEAARHAAAVIRARLKAADPHLDIREVMVRTSTSGDDTGTELFHALDTALATVPPGRVAGAIAITDGEVTDAPAADRLRLKAPLQVLITGRKNEADRKLSVKSAARFAIVGHNAQIALRIDDFGGPQGGSARLHVRVDGKERPSVLVPVGRTTTIKVPIHHEGENVVELIAEPGPHELTLQNNRAVIPVTGVRDRLHVLLVSGEPNAGERVWRSLLKADPSVELVHFTILRPPTKADTTPADELSLIAFPVDELFNRKLNSFDLVIFDRYRLRGLLPPAYFENIVRYVDNGGALLVSSGPEFTGDVSIYRTALASILPARPTGTIITQKFRPELTRLGEAHPVTAGLDGANSAGKPATWGSWFRLIGAQAVSGETLMKGPQDKPLLVLDHVGKGRVAELLSDQAWLWARDYEGGGPVAELLRRVAHWLMKEPELSEERLTANIQGGTIHVFRHTMANTAPPVILTEPDGKTRTLALHKAGPGSWRASAPIHQLGLYRLKNGTLTAVAAAGPLNPREMADVRATSAILKPLAQKSGGSVHWLVDGGVPEVRMVGRDETASGRHWIGLRTNNAYRVTSAEQKPLLPAWAVLLLVLSAVLIAWQREGR